MPTKSGGTKASATEQVANPWGSSLDKLKEWDPKGAELLLQVGTNPWTSGVLPRKEVELIYLALNCACTNLDKEGTRRQIRAALDAGATRDEIILVLKCGFGLAVHSCSLGAPILLEEMKAAGVKPSGGPKPETPACDAMRAIGQWNTAWDPFYELSPAWTDKFFAFGACYLQKRPLHTKVHGVDQHRIRRVHYTHVCARHAPPYQRSIEGGSDSRRNHDGSADLRFYGRGSVRKGRADSSRGVGARFRKPKSRGMICGIRRQTS